MNENLKKLFDEIRNNEELAEKLKKCTSPEEAYKAATEAVGGYTLDEFKDIMQKINTTVNSTEGAELSEQDLENVAGGLSTGDWLMIGGSVACGVGTITAGAISSAAGGI